MSGQLSFIKEYETYCPQIKAYNDRNECMQIHVRFPIVMTDLSGSKKRIRYARVEKMEHRWRKQGAKIDMGTNSK